MMNGYSGFGGMGVGGSVLMILVWVAVLVLVVWAVRSLGHGTR